MVWLQAFCFGKTSDVVDISSSKSSRGKELNRMEGNTDKATSPRPHYDIRMEGNTDKATSPRPHYDITSITSHVRNNSGELRNLNILIVDDSFIIIKMTKKALEILENKVDTASNGNIALNILQQKQYDLVLCDIQMPILGGIEAVILFREFESRCICEGSRLKKQKIIGMSANGHSETRESALKAGMDYFIPKPFRMEVLIGAWQRLLEIEKFEEQESPPQARRDDVEAVSSRLMRGDANGDYPYSSNPCIDKTANNYDIGSGENIDYVDRKENEKSPPAFVASVQLPTSPDTRSCKSNLDNIGNQYNIGSGEKIDDIGKENKSPRAFVASFKPKVSSDDVLKSCSANDVSRLVDKSHPSQPSLRSTDASLVSPGLISQSLSLSRPSGKIESGVDNDINKFRLLTMKNFISTGDIPLSYRSRDQGKAASSISSLSLSHRARLCKVSPLLPDHM